MTGSYSYRDEDGTYHQVIYTADKNGFSPKILTLETSTAGRPSLVPEGKAEETPFDARERARSVFGSLLPNRRV